MEINWAARHPAWRSRYARENA